MKFLKKILTDEQIFTGYVIPFYYGVSYRDWATRFTVYHITPINYVIKFWLFLYLQWNHVRTTLSKMDKIILENDRQSNTKWNMYWEKHYDNKFSQLLKGYRLRRKLSDYDIEPIPKNDDGSKPFVCFSDNELSKSAKITVGDKFFCPHCNGIHKLEGGKDEEGEENNLLLFYNCGEKFYLAGVDGRVIKRL